MGKSRRRQEPQDYQRVLKEATIACEDREKKIGEFKEELTETEKKIGKLNEELVVAREKVAEIEAARRTVGVFGVVATERGSLIVRRMVGKIYDVLDTIDQLAKLDFVLPVTIGMRLEILIAMPDDALSDIAASAYTELTLHVKKSKADPKQLALLDKQVLDVVCLACCRKTDPNCKVATKEGLTVAFGGTIDKALHSKLGNSLFQLFKRDFTENLAREPGYKPPEEDNRSRRVRKRVHREKRIISEPVSESRTMTGSSGQVQ